MLAATTPELAAGGGYGVAAFVALCYGKAGILESFPERGYSCRVRSPEN